MQTNPLSATATPRGPPLLKHRLTLRRQLPDNALAQPKQSRLTSTNHRHHNPNARVESSSQSLKECHDLVIGTSDRNGMEQVIRMERNK